MLFKSNPGLASSTKFSRPYGTKLVKSGSHTPSKARTYLSRSSEMTFSRPMKPCPLFSVIASGHKYLRG